MSSHSKNSKRTREDDVESVSSRSSSITLRSSSAHSSSYANPVSISSVSSVSSVSSEDLAGKIKDLLCILDQESLARNIEKINSSDTWWRNISYYEAVKDAIGLIDYIFEKVLPAQQCELARRLIENKPAKKRKSKQSPSSSQPSSSKNVIESKESKFKSFYKPLIIEAIKTEHEKAQRGKVDFTSVRDAFKLFEELQQFQVQISLNHIKKVFETCKAAVFSSNVLAKLTIFYEGSIYYKGLVDYTHFHNFPRTNEDNFISYLYQQDNTLAPSTIKQRLVFYKLLKNFPSLIYANHENTSYTVLSHYSSCITNEANNDVPFFTLISTPCEAYDIILPEVYHQFDPVEPQSLPLSYNELSHLSNYHTSNCEDLYHEEEDNTEALIETNDTFETSNEDLGIPVPETTSNSVSQGVENNSTNN